MPIAFETISKPAVADAIAPDRSEVRVLCRTAQGGMALFTLVPGAVSRPVEHRSVEEIWYVVRGNGRMWRKAGNAEVITELGPGISVAIRAGTGFQFRCDGTEPLEAVAVTMPPWPGADEAVAIEGAWSATL